MADTSTAGKAGLRRVFTDQLRNIAPVFTLVALVAFFSVASPSFFTTVNFMNIMSQVSITAIIAVGLTFVILTAEIDLSVAAIANAIGITVAFFTLQPDYVNIANLPMQGWIAIVLTLLSALAFGLVTAFGVTQIGIPSFIMTLAVMQIANGVSAMLVRGQIAYNYPDLITMLGSGSLFGVRWTIIVALLFLGVVAYAILGAQRSTKILGIFARLAERDGKRQYLAHIPRIQRYLARNLAHPALSSLAAWYKDRLGER